MLAGLVVAIALIPEAIAFSIIAGVDPRLGLFSSFVMAVAIAFLGGRPAMISAATGAIALVIAPVARDYGMDYFIATVLLAGLLQVLFAVIGVAKLMRFIPRSVMVGFVNALAILIFSAQVPQMLGVTWHTYAMIALGLAVIYLLPRVTSAMLRSAAVKPVTASLKVTVRMALSPASSAVSDSAIVAVGATGEVVTVVPLLLVLALPSLAASVKVVATLPAPTWFAVGVNTSARSAACTSAALPLRV